MTNSEEVTLLIEIARMYYYEDVSQEIVAKHFNMSRSQISKYLSKAKELGLIEVIVHDSLGTPHQELEAKLKEKFDLHEVICCESADSVVLKSNLANATLDYLFRTLESGSTVAVAAGTTIHEIANNYPYIYPITNLTFAPLSGGLGRTHMDIQANNIADIFAKHSGGSSIQLHAPVLVDSKNAKEMLMEQSFVKEVFDTAKKADVALVGIGNAPIYKEMSETYLEFENTDLFIEKNNIIGDVSYTFFDNQGESVDCAWNDRVIALSTSDIKNIPIRIGVAGGSNKVEAIKAALIGEIVNTLVIDLGTARLLLQT